MTDRYAITVAAAKEYGGPCAGAWVVRLGDQVHRRFAPDLGAEHAHDGVILAIARALRACRRLPLPVTVRCNQTSAIASIRGALRRRDAAEGTPLGRAVAAIDAAGSAVEFEFVANSSNDPDLNEARAKASGASRGEGVA